MAKQPAVPQVSTETWKTLVAAAGEFQRLAPWEWMHDSQVIGMRHPVSREVFLASIVGRLGEVFGLLVYRRDTGHRWLLNTILNDGCSEEFDDDASFDQDLVKAEFVAKRELTREDRGVLAAAGFSPGNKRGCVWPQFRSITPGGYPWHVTQDEAETMLFALPRVAVVARLLQAQPHVWDDHGDGDIGFLPDDFDPVRGELRPDQLDWHPMVPSPGAAACIRGFR